MSVTIHPGARLVGEKWITFDNHVIVDSFVFISASEQCPVRVGNYCHIAAFTSIAGGPVMLEDYTNIGAGSRLVAGSDNFRDALIGPTIPAQFRNVDRSGIVMRKHSTLGANCIVLPNVEMAEGAMAGAGTLVKPGTKPWGIYVGSPMKRIGMRDKNLCLYFEGLLNATK